MIIFIVNECNFKNSETIGNRKCLEKKFRVIVYTRSFLRISKHLTVSYRTYTESRHKLSVPLGNNLNARSTCTREENCIARRLIAFKDRCSTQADSASDSLALFRSFNLPFLFLSSFPPSLLSLSRSRTLPPHPFITSLLHSRLKKAVLPLPSFFLSPTFFPYRSSSSFSISPLDSRSRSPYLRSFSLSERAICPPAFSSSAFIPPLYTNTQRDSLIRCSPPSLHPFSQLPSSSLLPFTRLLLRILVAPFSFLENLTGYLCRLNSSAIDDRHETDGWRKKREGGGQRSKIETFRVTISILVSLRLIESVSHEEDFFFFLIWKKGGKEKERKGESNISVILQI